MMKQKRVARLLLAGALLAAAPAAEAFVVEAKGLFHRPSESIFREIYGNGVCFGGEVTVGLVGPVALWASADYYSRAGALTVTGEEVKIRVVPLLAGVKVRFRSAGPVRPYLAAGPGYFQYKEKSVIGVVEKGSLGFGVRAGAFLEISSGVLLDVQAGYTRCVVKPRELEADIGGFQAALGIGFEIDPKKTASKD